ncbi:membrane dipeptidase [Paenibacillus sp. UNCCL117]|uniref:dipeptidase n=1 Tax=unclassified Paenibacillus TaxID=185978 RepID=UPI000884B662|nr:MULTISPECIES: dipeptidase [unclassified Paenibacillus]SDC88803.1 membrane dipeptidase [Paenibacillus sp. cl123]SFW28400.1 membrane dipeptidase [Paenibacillus sp. UNCCL117]
MIVIDGHCDALLKMYEDPSLDFFSSGPSGLDVTYPRMCRSNIKVQFFAIYLSERIKNPRFDHYLEYADLFHRTIAAGGRVRPIKTRRDLEAVMNGPERGALLTLEGADALQGNPLYLRTLYQLGVRLIGTTWNYANWAADGVLEPRQAGFTRQGKSFIKQCNELGIVLDASHLSVRAFWDLAECSNKPFVATHSNSKAVCGHPRNLDDDQIRELIRIGGRIGLTFVPWFVAAQGASITGLLKHIDHILSLGGAGALTLGSDFDGIDRWIPQLEHAGQFDRLALELYKRYPDDIVEGILHANWHSFLMEQLPA